MRELIFLGGLFPRELRNKIEDNSLGVIQYAADALQWNIVEGLDYYLNKIKLINLLFIGSYPKRYKNLRIMTSNFSHKEGSKDINVGFINLTGFKIFSRYFMAKKALYKQMPDGNKIIMIYAIHTSLLLAAVNLKKRKPNIHLCLVVPDLPEYMNESKNIVFRVIKRTERNILNMALKKIDAFVLLSDHMASSLKVDNRPWIRVEGIFNSKDIMKNVEKEEFKTILYSGTLARRYGIINLLDAFSMIKGQNYRLWICGDGDASVEVNERAKQDSRITNFSQIPRSNVLRLQKKATVLVNPRTSEGAFTKYSFPSKIMEYMASGTPCIIHSLEGIPKEYLDYCFICNDETPLGLYRMITFVCEKDPEELNRFGEEAKQFILMEKTPIKQCGKIYNMLKSL